MTIETEVAALTTATTALTTAVAVQQTGVNAAVSALASVADKVNTELNLVDNTSDADKSISTLTLAAINEKQDTLISGDSLSTINGVSLLSGTPLVIERSPTSLSSLAYESRASLTLEPIYPNLPHVVDDSIIVEGLGMFMWVTTQLEPDDDETCFSTPSSGQWLLMTPAFDLLAAYELFEDSVVDEFIEDEIYLHLLLGT